MTNVERGLFNSVDQDKPSEDILPNGSYKYIYFAKDGLVIVSSLLRPHDHNQLINRSFNLETDDAGQFSLFWAKLTLF